MSEFVTLKENREFRRAYTRGRSFVSSDLVTYVIKNNTNNLRIGITTGKKIGKAYERNRSRRIIRAALREVYPDIRGNFDLVFVARGKTPHRKSSDILRSMRKHLKEAGLLEK